jgi:hypothetical protein
MLYISFAVKKPSGDSSAQWKAWGIPSVFVALVGTSLVATWMFQAGCMYDCGSIRLDRV